MDNTFVRKDFYVEPPAKDAPVEEWNNWLKKDNAKARAAKATFTKSQTQAELPEFAQGVSVRKVGGVYRQSTAIGFVGEGENNGHLEPVVAPSQERDYILARMGGNARGVSHTLSGNEKRKARRARRKARKAGL
jgi:hypothetical protein